MLDDVRASININRPTSGWSDVWFFAGVFLLTRIGSEEALTRRRAGGVNRHIVSADASSDRGDQIVEILIAGPATTS
ncbi:MAG: hypothetical protein KGQ48_15750 [Bradyrhizobium sp.]|nr:hypothetical protein [Bradyrhizobium sp.]